MHEMFAALGLPDNPAPMRSNTLYAMVPFSAAIVEDEGADAMVMADRLALVALRKVADRLNMTLDETTIRRHSAIASALVPNADGDLIYADIRHSIHGPPISFDFPQGRLAPRYPDDLKPARFTVFWNAEASHRCICQPAYTDTDSPELVRDPACQVHPDDPAQYSGEAPF